jgi:hypothetical protein
VRESFLVQLIFCSQILTLKIILLTARSIAYNKGNKGRGLFPDRPLTAGAALAFATGIALARQAWSFRHARDH